MKISEIKELLVSKLSLRDDEIYSIEVSSSEELAKILDQNRSRYSEPQNCYVNSTHLVLDGPMEYELEYVLVYGIRLNSQDTISALPRHPDMAKIMTPLSDSVYAFGHAIVYDFENEIFYDPTLQDTDRGLADHYFLIKRFEYEELADHLRENDHVPPEL